MATIKFTAAEKKTRKAESLAFLKGKLSAKDTVYTILRSRAPSGMSRRIGFVIVTADHDGKPGILDITRWVADVLEYTTDTEKEGIAVKGFGTDHGCQCVMNLSSYVFEGEDQPYYKLNQRWL